MLTNDTKLAEAVAAGWKLEATSNGVHYVRSPDNSMIGRISDASIRFESTIAAWEGGGLARILEQFSQADFFSMTCPSNVRWVGVCREDGMTCVYVRSGQREVCWLNNVDVQTACAAKRWASERFGL